MSQATQGFDITLLAGANLNTTTSDWQPVYINSVSSVRIANSTTHKPIGILQNRPNSGTGATCVVRIGGTSKLLMNDTGTAGDLVILGSGGALRGTDLSITSAAIRYSLGRIVEASAASGTVVQCIIMPQLIAGSLTVTFD